jgi:Enoyl-CoA hydratase/isomerase
LKQWEKEKLSLVIIEGAGEKAFCAGGDIRAITSDPNRGSVEQAEFFAEEYKLNNLVSTSLTFLGEAVVLGTASKQLTIEPLTVCSKTPQLPKALENALPEL